MRLFFKLFFLSSILILSGFQSFSQCPSITGATNTITDVSCFGFADGSIRIRLNTGATPSNYELFDLNANEFVPVNVPGDPTSAQRTIDADFMGVTFTNVYSSIFRIHIFKLGCPPVLYSGGGGFVVNEPPQIVVDTPVITPDCNPATGPGNQGGSITLNVSGGVSPYTYLWNDGLTLPIRPVLDAGTYSVVITDKNNCQVTVSGLIVPGSPVTSAITGDIAVCANETGIIYSVTNTAGSTYAWTVTGGVQTGGTNSNSITVDWGTAGAGNVQVVETNAAGCPGAPVNLAVTINAIPPPQRLRETLQSVRMRQE